MAQVRQGDMVRAFLDANLTGIVESISYENSGETLMVGGVPPTVAVASIRCADGSLRRVRTTELYVETQQLSR
jgi:hypothetical protein